MHIFLILFIYLKMNIFKFCHSKMAAINAEIGRVGKLELEFQQVPFIQMF